MAQEHLEDSKINPHGLEDLASGNTPQADRASPAVSRPEADVPDNSSSYGARNDHQHSGEPRFAILSNRRPSSHSAGQRDLSLGLAGRQ
jgi:hypothetical protein